MNKFKVGDKIVRTGRAFAGENMFPGNTYVVADIRGQTLRPQGSRYWYDAINFQPAPDLIKASTLTVELAGVSGGSPP